MKYIGVGWHKNCRKFEARVNFQSVKYYVGTYTLEVDSALAYDKAVSALKLDALLPKNFNSFTEYKKARDKSISNIDDTISCEEIMKCMAEMVAKKCGNALIKVDSSAQVALSTYFKSLLPTQLSVHSDRAVETESSNSPMIKVDSSAQVALSKHFNSLLSTQLNGHNDSEVETESPDTSTIKVDSSAQVALLGHFKSLVRMHLSAQEKSRDVDVDVIDGEMILCQTLSQANQETEELNGHIQKSDAILQSSSPVFQAVKNGNPPHNGTTNNRKTKVLRHVLFAGTKRNGKQNAATQSKRAKKSKHLPSPPVVMLQAVATSPVEREGDAVTGSAVKSSLKASTAIRNSRRTPLFKSSSRTPHKNAENEFKDSSSSAATKRKSSFKGVYSYKKTKLHASLRFKNRTFQMGRYKLQTDCAHARDSALRYLKGQTKDLNFDTEDDYHKARQQELEEMGSNAKEAECLDVVSSRIKQCLERLPEDIKAGKCCF